MTTHVNELDNFDIRLDGYQNYHDSRMATGNEVVTSDGNPGRQGCDSSGCVLPWQAKAGGRRRDNAMSADCPVRDNSRSNEKRAI